MIARQVAKVIELECHGDYVVGIRTERHVVPIYETFVLGCVRLKQVIVGETMKLICGWFGISTAGSHF
jgi:hypothetical protein